MLEALRVITRWHLLAVAVVGAALAVPIWLLFTNATIQGAGISGFIGLFLGTLSLLIAGLRFALARRKPRALGLAALAAGLAAAAIAVAAIGAYLGRSRAEAIAASNEALEPGMREWMVAAEQASARTAALLGLAAIPGFVLAFFALLMVIGARRTTAASNQSLAEMGPLERKNPAAPVFVALFASTAAFVAGLVFAIVVASGDVTEAPHPREPRLKETAAAFARGDMRDGCDGLEAALAPEYAPRELLDLHLAERFELAHRCVTYRIDALPASEACEKERKILLESRTVELADADERVKRACKR